MYISFPGSLSYLGEFVGLLFIGPTLMKLGHRTTALMTLPILVALWLTVSLCRVTWLLFTSRFFTGFIIGIFYPTSTTYILEITHSSIRGYYSAP